jgi:SAM-dependent methyltransferase
MRDHNKAFCRLVAETFDCPGPVFEFGSYQVDGQIDYANLRSFFAGKPYVGCDFREGPGVDRVEDVTAINMADNSAGTVICLETFEHVFEVRRAFDEVFRILRPGGVFILTSPFNFRIHGYPDDYWRISPSCLRRLLTPYGGRVVGAQGHASFPHTVMSLAIKTPAPLDFEARADRLVRAYHGWLAQAEAAIPTKQKIRRAVGQLYRSKGERNFVSGYYNADFVMDSQSATLSKVG